MTNIDRPSRSTSRSTGRLVVLRTAARIFSERGFHQTTLADVAEELNVSKPALYHYFKSKDEILLEIQQAAIAQMMHEASEAGGETAREQLTAFVQAYVKMIIDDFGTCLIMTGALPLEPKNRKAVRAGSKAIEKVVGGLRSPSWPESVLGRIDRTLARRGRALYAQECAGCHAATVDHHSEDVITQQIVPLETIGTDPLSAQMIHDKRIDTGPWGFGTQGYFDALFSVSTKVFASVGSSEAVIAKIRRPSALRVPQRRSDATQSAAVTGWPSCHFRPSRSVNV